MTRHLDLNEFEDLEPEVIFEGHRRLRGYQAIDLHEAIVLFGWRSHVDLMPIIARDRIILLLKYLGYRETWAGEVGEPTFGLMWLRDPWPSDAAALSGIPSCQVEECH
ncbi:hypothetical protein [Sphingorhabdus sp. 109]|uniref:hypothetical protein n=1 Tax=Sphingorhabdus sp. 109 TaxID=2653173 RepID=UPI0012F3E997|nr:hypothetical protein [Sphingorhabdus sp. 109]VWX56953.1 conserved hypothetical protein [Sphingorhabdus sp. 109]